MAVAATNTRAADSSVDPELAARDWIYENGATVCDKWARHGMFDAFGDWSAGIDGG